MPEPIRQSALFLDHTPRIAVTTTVVASPTAATETIIASLTVPNFGDVSVVSGIDLSAWAAFTVGGSGTAVRLRIRQTNVAGTVVADTGALTGGVAAAALLAQDVAGFDSGAGVGVYVLTLTVTAAASGSTVSAVKLRAIVT